MHVQRVGILQALHSFQLPPAVRTRACQPPKPPWTNDKSQDRQRSRTSKRVHQVRNWPVPSPLQTFPSSICGSLQSLLHILYHLLFPFLAFLQPYGQSTAIKNSFLHWPSRDHPDAGPLLVGEQAPNSLTKFVVVFNPHHRNDYKIE